MPEPRTDVPSGRVQPRFAGLSTFCRFPRVQDVRAEHLPLDWIVYGVPFDGGVTYRPGARFGPRAVRDESQYVKLYHLQHRLLLSDVLSLADGGDAPVMPYDCKASTQRVAEWATALPDPGRTKLLAIGGDHTTALANLRATHARTKVPAGGLALIHFDSHLDTVDSVWDEQYGHASPFRRAIEEGLVNPARMLSIGIKGPLNTPTDLDFARDHGVTIVTYDQWRREGTSTIDAFLATLASHPAYVTFDIDAVDPAFAPGTGTPSVGGFTSAQALDLVRGLARAPAGQAGRLNLVGADVVEVLPDRDHAGITALLAAHIAFEILCLDATPPSA